MSTIAKIYSKKFLKCNELLKSQLFLSFLGFFILVQGYEIYLKRAKYTSQTIYFQARIWKWAPWLGIKVGGVLESSGSQL